MLSALPLPPVRRFRKRSPAQRAAIQRATEARKIRKMGGGKAAARALLEKVHKSDLVQVPHIERTFPALDRCTLCHRRLIARERGKALWADFGLAHERCLLDNFSGNDYSPAIIACEMAIRSRLAREIQGRA